MGLEFLFLMSILLKKVKVLPRLAQREGSWVKIQKFRARFLRRKPSQVWGESEGVARVLSVLYKPEDSSRKQVHLDQARRSATRLEQMDEADDEMTTDRTKLAT